MINDDPPLSRRGFLRAAALGTASVAVLLKACTPAAPGTTPAQSGASTTKTGTPGSGQVKLPTYVAFQGPQPDLAGSADGLIPPAYFNYPRNPVKSVPQPVGNGEDVTAMMYTTQAAPTPVEQNPAWQQVHKELGVTMKFPIIQLADYPTKLNTTIASGSLPEFLQSQCSDLTPFVSSDAVKEFPNLANLPTFAWRNTVFNGKIFAVPVVRTSISASIMFGKGKVLEPAGALQFKNTDDFMHKMKQLTAPNAQQWGIGFTAGAASSGVPPFATWFLESFGAPNGWREAGGKLTKDWETEEFKAAIGFVRDLWAAGVVHPDGPTATVNQAAQHFYAGRTVLWQNGFTIGDVAWNRAHAQDAQFGMRALAPFSHDGTTKPVHHLGPGTALLTVIKKTSPDQIKKLLGILNYFSAPFGTAEFLLIWYGLEGITFNFDPNGNPIVTPEGAPYLFIPWPNIGSPASVLYNAQSADYARVMHKDASLIQGLGIQNPVVGLYSNTHAARAVSLNQRMADGLTDIIFGRAELSSFDQLVRDWRAQGGDQIRSEFEAALQDARAS